MKNKKDIIIIGNYPKPYGGVPVLVKSLSSYFSQLKYNVCVISGGTDGLKKINDNLKIIKPKLSKRILAFFSSYTLLLKILGQIPLLSYVNFKYNFRLISYTLITNKILNNKNETTIICFNLFNYGIIGGIIKEYNPNIKLVVVNFGEVHSMKKYPFTYKKLYEKVIDSIDLKLSPTKHCAKIYQKLTDDYDYDIKDNFCEPIVPGVDLKNFSIKNTHLNLYIKSSLLKKRDSNILYVGRITKELGINFLLKSIRKIFNDQKNIENIKFTIIGQKAELVDEVNKLINLFPKNIELFLDVNTEFLKSAIVNSDFLIAPSINDRACGCLVASEAGALKKTILASNIGGIPEYIVNNKSGILFEPNNIDDFISKILKLSYDKTLLKNLQKGNYELVQSKFGMDFFDQKFYSKLLSYNLI